MQATLGCCRIELGQHGHRVGAVSGRKHLDHALLVRPSRRWLLQLSPQQARSELQRKQPARAMGYLYLAIAIVAEAAATVALKAPVEFTKLIALLVRSVAAAY